MSIYDYFESQVRKHQSAVAFRYLNQVVTYSDVLKQATQLSLDFGERGVKKGYRMLFYCDHPLQTIIGYFACHRIGAICIPINLDTDLQETLAMLSDIKADGCFVSNGTFNTINPLLKNISFFSLHPDCNSDKKTINHNDEKCTLKAMKVNDEDAAFIFMTSGSTGKPKGSICTHHNVISYITYNAVPYPIEQTDIFLCHTPMQSDMSIFALYLPLTFGAACVLLPNNMRRNPLFVNNIIVQEKITVLQLVPSAIRMLMLQGWSDKNAPSVRILIFTGEKMPLKELSELRERFTKARLYNVFGITETNDVFYYQIPEHPTPIQSLPLGIPLPHVNVVLVNDSMAECSEGEIGELCVSSNTVMKGYDGIDAKDIFISISGNLAYPTKDLLLFQDGMYHFVGRKDNMIKIDSQRVFPSLVEEVIMSEPTVIEAAVVSLVQYERPYLAAYVYGNIDKLRLRAYCSTLLPTYSIPVLFVLVSDPLPKTSSGKIDYSSIKRTLQHQFNLNSQ